MERKNPRRQGKTAYEKNFYEKTQKFFPAFWVSGLPYLARRIGT